MARNRTYSDEQLKTAVASNTSWRGVLRSLGLNATSGAAIESVRTRAADLSIDHGHFGSRSRCTDDALRHAVAVETSWAAVADRLGVARRHVPSLREHAGCLGLDIGHLLAPAVQPSEHPGELRLNRLPRAGSMLAAGWFIMAGFDVCWPLEPARYDLLVTGSDTSLRVQVKTTVINARSGGQVWLSTTSSRPRRRYTRKEIDEFFIIDGDLCCYRLPIRSAGGRHAVALSELDDCRVPSLGEARRVSSIADSAK